VNEGAQVGIYQNIERKASAARNIARRAVGKAGD
jgi:hypothetical protein